VDMPVGIVGCISFVTVVCKYTHSSLCTRGQHTQHSGLMYLLTVIAGR
jgi:hypothetical protein